MSKVEMDDWIRYNLSLVYMDYVFNKCLGEIFGGMK